MSELLNEIIKVGGTTALTDDMSASDIADWMASDPDQSAWIVAEDDGGKIMGFQFFAPHPDLPPEAADMATFVRVGAVQLGIGSALFSETAIAAARMGLIWLNANIRADNSGGLTYYQSRGFRTYKIDENVALADGSLVEKIHKRYDI
jgi:GNAT superfamily N-acetyltransferase